MTHRSLADLARGPMPQGIFMLMIGSLGAFCRSEPPLAAEAKMLRASGCGVCHASDKQLVGPTYRDISAKYRGKDDALPRLVRKVRGGSQGVWGSVPMPPNPQISDEDAKAMVSFILSLPAK